MDTLGCACPKCEWEDSEVKKTTKVTGATLRVRVCRQCGHIYPTKEEVLELGSTGGSTKKNSANGNLKF